MGQHTWKWNDDNNNDKNKRSGRVLKQILVELEDPMRRGPPNSVPPGKRITGTVPTQRHIRG